MRKALLAFALVFAGAFQAGAHDAVTTENGLKVSVQACTDNIFRIRISPRDSFSESLMERYGILKSDWLSPHHIGGDSVLSTKAATVSLDSRSGDLQFSRPDGTEISRISFVTASDPLVEALGNEINEKFASLHVASNGGIIGDDDGRFSEKDKAESGDMSKASIISIGICEGERFYGGGSTSRDHIQHRGELLRMWTTYQHTEIPMPFMMSSRGWGVFNNTTRKNFFDVGAHDGDRLNIYNTCDEADFYIFVSDGMPGVLDLYTQVTGRSYVLPKWAYGIGFGPNMRENQFDILNDAVHFRQADVPCDFFWLEPQWMEKRYDFSMEKKWNTANFSPEPYWLENKYPKKEHPELFVGKLKSMGFRLGLWLCEEYDLSVAEEDIIAEREGRPVSGQPHWMDHLRPFLDLGVRGFKMDPARTIDEHTFRDYYNGRTDKEMHNLNQILLPKQMATMTRDHLGRRTWHHYTAGWSGVQHWGASTSGDNGGGKTALYDQLNLGMSGFMNTSCDVMHVERELEMQGLHFGVFLPWVQINSWFHLMHPFYYDDDEQAIYRKCVKTRYSLAPYVYSAALEGSQNGMPMVRAMPLVFPEDSKTYDMCSQYMFGGSFLVGIFTDTVYLPEGVWYDYWSGEKVISAGEDVKHDIPGDCAGPLFVRGGSIIPTQHDVRYLGTKPFDKLVVKVYPGADAEYVMLEDDGETYAFETGGIARTHFSCRQNGKGLEVAVAPVKGGYEAMPGSRSFEFEIHLDAKPSKVFVNGVQNRDWSYADGVLRIGALKVRNEDGVSIAVR